MTNTTNYRFSFSGADARAMASFGSARVVTKKQIQAMRKKLAPAQKRLDLLQSKIANNEQAISRAAGKISDADKLKLIKEVNNFKKERQELSDLIVKYTQSNMRSGGNEPFLLESLGTVSLSIHEPKGMVRSLGFRSIKGVTRSVRTIAGSMIFTVLDQHPLVSLMMKDPYNKSSYARDDNDYSGDFKPKPATIISPFDLTIRYVSEYPTSKKDKIAGSTIKIYAIEFLNEGIVTSVNDMVTEVTYQFIARDFEQFTSDHGVGTANLNAYMAGTKGYLEGRITELERLTGQPFKDKHDLAVAEMKETQDKLKAAAELKNSAKLFYDEKNKMSRRPPKKKPPWLK